MDVSKTRIQLIHQALDNLGVMQPGQTPSDETVSKMDNLVDPMIADLAAVDIAYVHDAGQPGPTAGEIEPAMFLWLAHILADCAKSSFGQADDPALYVLRQQSEDRLRTINRPARTRRTLSTDPILSRGAKRSGYGSNFLTGR